MPKAPASTTAVRQSRRISTPRSSKPKTTPVKRETESSPLSDVDKPNVKSESDDDIKPVTTSDTPSKPQTSPQTLKARKSALHNKMTSSSPFPQFNHPSPSECYIAHDILVKIHGPRVRPKEVIASTTRAGCGDSPSVLDALVRTILSQNTTDANSTRAKLSMDKVYGSSDNWAAVVEGGQPKLEEAIRCGGLAGVKSKVILRILDQSLSKYGTYSLDHLHKSSTEDAMSELLGFDGVGPKTASCVLLFCLQREDFAVDTHVHRITGLIGWRPKNANREQTYHHLNKKIPDELKYALHILFVLHGKKCEECKAGGRSGGKCELRVAFREGGKGMVGVEGKEGVKMEVEGEEVKGEGGEDFVEGMKEEVKEEVKAEAA